RARAGPPAHGCSRRSPPGRRSTPVTRVLVVANDAVDPTAISAHEAEVLVVAPALSGRLDYWSGDDRRARREAERRLAESLAAFSAQGVAADGLVGDADPLLAIEDSLRLLGGGARRRTSWCSSAGSPPPARSCGRSARPGLRSRTSRPLPS